MLSHIISIDRKQSKCLIMKNNFENLLQQTGQCHERKNAILEKKDRVSECTKGSLCLRSGTELYFINGGFGLATRLCAERTILFRLSNTYKAGAASQLLYPTAKAP
jgi:hypothetical protein